MVQMIYTIIMYAMQIYYYLLFISVLVTWFPDIQRTAVGRILFKLTEPYFGIFRRFIPAVRLGGGYMDFSPIVALIVWRMFVVSGVSWLLVKVLT
ncbi:YggT family protein [Tumebacillus sp. ITR2]|jgi:YggT family protein|uniref:YggT family protein n=1 Tax=Tumebacillus amylolyticus TaxID=2801339 RepID=A0ABS1JGW2_9BACL|nr:YggT family protein [Tumebacillus amylolyticus]MBL0389465.1 YggT family protein [Tumebacillus amylolyticus]